LDRAVTRDGNVADLFALTKANDGNGTSAQSHRRIEHRFEDVLEIGRGGRDHAQHLGGGRLLLQRRGRVSFRALGPPDECDLTSLSRRLPLA